MTEYAQLTKEYEEKVAILQQNCQHKTSNWYEQMLSPGKFTGTRIRICKNCHKELAQKPTKEELRQTKKEELLAYNKDNPDIIKLIEAHYK